MGFNFESSGGGSGTVTVSSGGGAGTTDRLVKFTGATTIGDALWKETSVGKLEFQNFSSEKGTKTSPLVNLTDSTSAGTGFFTNAAKDLFMSANGSLYAAVSDTDAGFNIYRASSASTTYYTMRYLGSEGLVFYAKGSGAPGIYTFTSGDTTGTTKTTLGFNNAGVSTHIINGYKSSDTSFSGRYWVLTYDTVGGDIGRTAFAATRAGGQGVGADYRFNAFTAYGHADITGVGGTTTANASTTITGSSTLFLEDFGIGDRVSLSSASSTYATITAIASNTSMTVDTALGNGTSQTLNKKQALFRLANSSGTTKTFVDDLGRMTQGAPITGPTFFYNPATLFAANGTITAVSSGLSDIIQIGAVSVFEASPSADTNTGLGAGVYAAQGFNLNLIGSNKFNGGIPIGGYPNPISAVGAFGQANVRTDDTVDGCIGLLCTGGLQGTGATVDDYVAGVFACSTSSDFPSGGSLNRGTGGFFTVYTDTTSDTSITTARGGWFYEPYVTGGGTATITNKTAIEVQGTLSITEDDDSSTGNIDAFAITTSYQYMTGAAPVLRGVIPDTFNKVIIFDFANTATIANENATPTANRRITTGTGADLTNVKSACLVYNTTTSRWRVQWWRV